MAERIDGIALGSIAVGVALLYAGIKGKSVTSLIQGFVQGKAPATAAAANQISGTAPAASQPFTPPSDVLSTGNPGGGTDTGNRALGKLMAGGYGWATGAEWAALDNGWGTLESGWNNQIYNGGTVGGPYEPGKAYGIPQANGHGSNGAPYPDGNSGNPPGAGGSSSAVSQIAWGLAYIKQTYGSPSQVPGWTGGSYSGY